MDYVNEKGEKLCFYSFVETECEPEFNQPFKYCSGCSRVKLLEKHRNSLSTQTTEEKAN